MGTGKTGRKHEWSCLVITRKNLFSWTTLWGDSSQSCIYLLYAGVTIFQVRTVQEESYSNVVFYKQNNPQESLYSGERKKKEHLLKHGFFYKQINPQFRTMQSKGQGSICTSFSRQKLTILFIHGVKASSFC